MFPFWKQEDKGMLRCKHELLIFQVRAESLEIILEHYWDTGIKV